MNISKAPVSVCKISVPEPSWDIGFKIFLGMIPLDVRIKNPSPILLTIGDKRSIQEGNVFWIFHSNN